MSIQITIFRTKYEPKSMIDKSCYYFQINFGLRNLLNIEIKIIFRWIDFDTVLSSILSNSKNLKYNCI